MNIIVPDIKDFDGYEILVEIDEYPNLDSETLLQRFQSKLHDYFVVDDLYDVARIVNTQNKQIDGNVRFASEDQNNIDAIQIESIKTNEQANPETRDSHDLVSSENWFDLIIGAIKKTIGSLNLSFDIIIEDFDESLDKTIVSNESKHEHRKNLKSKRIRLVFSTKS